MHNWWANGVFVDFSSGNWGEGLTAYLSDHLIKEQRGQGKEYRRTALQKYTDYAAESKDFPLTEFRSRHSSATEAVGYGKTLMFFHMLRLQLGDKVFIKGLQKFYREFKFKRATFENLREVFEEVSGKDLQIEFNQWIKQTGAPEIRINNASAQADRLGYKLTAVLEQVQEAPAYTLHIPITVTLQDFQEAYQTTVLMDSKRSEIFLHVPSKPLRLEVDPAFDLFRRLDRYETPPALSRAFGSDKALVILPSSASEDILNEYRKVAESWQKSPSRQMEIKLDNEINELPSDRTVWLFGKENLFNSKIIDAMKGYNVSINDSGVSIGQSEIKRKDHSIIFTIRHPDEPDSALVWVSTDNAAAIPGLGRKLPHYGKYSYLAFEGTEPSIVLKGRWPTVNSPMSVPVQLSDNKEIPSSLPLQRVETTPSGVVTKLAPRQALAYLPAVFSEERMISVISFLADEKMKGRGLGTAELDKAADFIASKFHEAGLEPAGGKPGSYFQEWKAKGGKSKEEVVLKNVIGIIPGNNPDRDGQSVVFSAHYDHLGLGWPDVRQGNKGKIHPGADDNASGVAILLELAQILGKTWKPDRTVVFVAFTGEEAGLMGSKHYVKNEKNFPADKIIGVLNLDTVGRLDKNKLMVFGTGSAREWIHIFMGASYVTGVPIEPVSNDFGSSDQKSFLDAGVPAVQFFSGPHLDYHSPTDTIDKVDKAGLIKVASVVKEAVEYLTSREEPLTSLLDTQRDFASEKSTKPDQGRKVSLGTIP
ncbi:MAG: M20/M25/M40 family metallo-hydrolase, partial [Nitrospinota bacterium]